MRTVIQVRLQCDLHANEDPFVTQIPRGTATPLERATLVLSHDGRHALVTGTMVLDDAAELIEEQGKGKQ